MKKMIQKTVNTNQNLYMVEGNGIYNQVLKVNCILSMFFTFPRFTETAIEFIIPPGGSIILILSTLFMGQTF